MSKRGQNEGSIYKREDGRWAAVLNLGYEGGKRKRKYFYGDTRREVQEQLTKALRDQQQGIPIPIERQTIAQFLEEWISKSHRLEPTTIHSYKQMMRLYLIPDLGAIPLVKLTPQQVQEFIDRRFKAGLSPRTLQYCQSILRAALNRALKWGLVSRNVAALVDIPRQQQTEQTFLDPQEAKHLLESIKGDQLEALYTVALAIGLRKGEALGLRWQDIDFDAHVVHVRVELQRLPDRGFFLKELKTMRSRRQLALPDFAIPALLRHRERQEQEKVYAGEVWSNEWDLVFTSELGHPLFSRNVSRSFHRMLKRAGMERMRFYDIRHTCASLLLAQEVPMRLVMEILGHSQITLTANLYTHVIPPLMEGAAGKLNDLLKPST